MDKVHHVEEMEREHRQGPLKIQRPPSTEYLGRVNKDTLAEN